MNKTTPLDFETLLYENAELRARLEEAEDTLAAIRHGDVDALIVGQDIYTLDSANSADNKLRKDVLAQMEDAVLAFDTEHHVIFMNPAAERQYRQTVSATLGHRITELYRESWPDSASEAAARKSMQDTGAYRAHSIHTRSDGSSFHVEASLSQLRDLEAKVIGYLAVIRDISERIQAEETLFAATMALSRRERQFSTLVENSPDIIARLDRKHRYLYVSPIVERYTGLNSTEYIGKTNIELGMPERLCSIWDRALKKVFKTGTVDRIKYDFTIRDNEDRVFETRLLPEFGDDGSVESVLTIASDITEQEQINDALWESQARLQFTLDSAEVGEWELDLGTDAARHSLRHDRCFGYTEPVAYWGMQIMLSHVHPDDRERIESAFRQSIAFQENLHFECRVLWPDGSLHWIEVHGSLHVEEGKPPRMLGIVFDTTIRKQAEESLRDADRRKDEFLATLAHELRNPLAPIRNALQIMQLTPEPSAHEHARSIIERQLQQMVHLVDDLMDVSRISQGKVELRKLPVDVTSVIQAAIETSRPLIEAGKHEITVQLPPPGQLMIDADITRLTQIIANLLNNAAKYTPEGGRIDVSAERNGNDVNIAVQDSGIGIPTEMLPRVFDMFAQVDRTFERSQGGLGIGLALVKRLVEMHGGTVQAYSDGHGKGSRFVVMLPLLPGTANHETAVDDKALNVEPDAELRVLVVDDNIDSAVSLSQVLTLLGYQTQMAHDGAEAVRVAETFRPHVTLMDIGLPILNGHEAGQRVRQQAWAKDMLLIALSGWGQEIDRRKSKQAGFDHHFVKPVDIEVLIKLLAQIKPC